MDELEKAPCVDVGHVWCCFIKGEFNKVTLKRRRAASRVIQKPKTASPAGQQPLRAT